MNQQKQRHKITKWDLQWTQDICLLTHFSESKYHIATSDK